MVKMQRWALVVGLGLCFAPLSVWAESCQSDAPLFSTASSQQLLPTTFLQSFTVVARDRSSLPGCLGDKLTITAQGLEAMGPALQVNTATSSGHAAMTFTLNGAPRGFYNVTYAVSDTAGNTNTVTLPVSVDGHNSNKTPILDPVSDLVARAGERRAFAIGLSDSDRDLDALSQQTLVIDGLPRYSIREYTRLTSDRVAAMITIQSNERGVYRVNIVGKDMRGGRTIAQMRIVLE